MIRVEYARQRRIRERNKVFYRIAHWPIWITVFFLAPGPLTFNLFARGFSRSNFIWLIAVILATGLAGLFGQLPGVEPRPYIVRFCEAKPNPLYRRICYTFAWNALLNFTLLNLVGLAVAVITGTWYLRQIYTYLYFPLFALVLLLGAFGRLPRVSPSTKDEGLERRYFYGAVWAATLAEGVLLVLWKVLPRSHAADVFKLIAFLLVLSCVTAAGAVGALPRTRPILPGELLVAD
ncbi:MAG: hypothetical protein JO211_08585 [Acidobacteriaceae bacterium]|nr:hypothetical protein [Acidobacteriaceae bacterium]